MTAGEREEVCRLLRERYGDAITIEVQEPCKALWIVIEGENGDFTANVTHANAPLLRLLLAG
jgi:hypothetical protein